jgi:hypothetical protein
MQARKGRTTTSAMNLKTTLFAIPLSAILWVALYQAINMLLAAF